MMPAARSGFSGDADAVRKTLQREHTAHQGAGDVRQIFVLPRFVDLNNIRVIQLRRCLSFDHESPSQIRLDEGMERPRNL